MLPSLRDGLRSGAFPLKYVIVATGTGATVTLPGDPFTLLFSESSARALIEVRPGAEEEFAALCARAGVPAAVLGTTGGPSLRITGLFEVPLAELAAVHQAPLPALFG